MASSLSALGESVTSLEAKLGEAAEPTATLAARFDESSWAETLIEEYRGGNAEQREAIEAQVQQAIVVLGEAQSEAQRTGQEFVDSALHASDAAVQLAEQLPAKAEELITGHGEAAAEAQEALRAASSAETFEGVSDELLDYLMVYIETADKLKASHAQAVEEREAAEAAAAAAAARARASSGGSGGGGSSSGPRLCYRYTWLGTVLEPC